MPPSVTPPIEPQSAAAVLMVRPSRFAFNPQTAPSNAFQSTLAPPASVAQSALREFDALAAALSRAGVEVIVAADTPEPVKPDAVFPNNWVSFHRDGTVVFYPMLAANRRWERREDLVLELAHAGGFHISRTVDLSHREQQGQYLEGTGSLVLDRTHRVAYACLSPRTHLDVLGEFAQLLDYDLVTFEACDAEARPIYHTNVLMAVAGDVAVLCSATIPDAVSRSAVAEMLRATGHELVDISMTQMRAFAGNLLELAAPSGPLIALSDTAWNGLAAEQRRSLERHAGVLVAAIPTIEQWGGGGVRCMLAEIHLPRR